MTIAVTYTGKDDKQQMYMDWLHLLSPESELVILSAEHNSAQDLERCDAMVLTGGGDIDPQLYGEQPGPLTKGIDRKRDDFEFSLLDHALEHQMPVLGICRGLQTVNTYLGGTLIQDLPSQGFMRHAGEKNTPVIEHEITVWENSLLHDITRVRSGTVNSYHHQGVGKVADDLMATSSTTDNVTESLEWKEKKGKSFLLLVQWHPERMTDDRNPLKTGVGERFLHEIVESMNT